MSRPIQFTSYLSIALFTILGTSIVEARAQPDRTATQRASNAATTSLPPDVSQKFDEILTKIAIEQMPEQYEETKHWGKQAERWDGIKFRREGWKLETHRRKKMVNHGTWKKYSASLRNPNEEFSIQIQDLRETPNGKIAFDFHLIAHLNIEGRQAEWLKGVQLYSVNAVGHTKIRLKVSMELEVKMGIGSFPPDLIFIPKATEADIMIDEFRIDRISKIGGEIAQQVTRGVRTKLDEKVAEKEVKLVEKINKQLDKKRDRFRFSLADAMKTKWAQPLTGILSKNR